MAADGATSEVLTAEHCIDLKAKGNAAYAAGEIDCAILSYTEAVDNWHSVVRNSPQPEALEEGDQVLYEPDALGITGSLFGEITKAFPLLKEYHLKDLASGKEAKENNEESYTLRCFDKADLIVIPKQMFELQLACLQNLAAAYLKQGLHEEAVIWADQALAMDPRAPKALMRKGMALLRGGERLSRAQRVLTLANQVSPKDREVQKALDEVKSLRAARAEILRPVNRSKLRKKKFDAFKRACMCVSPDCQDNDSSDANDYKAPPKEKKVLEKEGADLVLKVQKEWKTETDVASIEGQGTTGNVGSRVEPKAVVKPEVTLAPEKLKPMAKPFGPTEIWRRVPAAPPTGDVAGASKVTSILKDASEKKAAQSTNQTEASLSNSASEKKAEQSTTRTMTAGKAKASEQKPATKGQQTKARSVDRTKGDDDAELAAKQLEINLAAIKAARDAAKGTAAHDSGPPDDSAQPTSRSLGWQCASVAVAAVGILVAVGWSFAPISQGS